MEANHQEFENNQTGSNPAEREGKFEEILEKCKDYEYIYRILPLHRLIDGIRRGVSTVTRITSWEDTWEAALFRSNWTTLVDGDVTPVDTKRVMKRLYAQCWFGVEESDAMWRMYSCDKKSVKIRSTPRKLLRGFWDNYADDAPEQRFRIEPVEYLNGDALLAKLEEIDLLSFEGQGDSLFLKREEFACEREIRLIYRRFTDNDDNENIDLIEDYLPLLFQWNDAIDQIVFDPRLSHDEFEGMENELSGVLGVSDIAIIQSDLYAPLEINRTVRS